jgi:hypothetical protein
MVSLHLQPFSAAGFFGIREIQRPKWSPWELNAAPRGKRTCQDRSAKPILASNLKTYICFAVNGVNTVFYKQRESILGKKNQQQKGG